jgi:hypothetical protein
MQEIFNSIGRDRATDDWYLDGLGYQDASQLNAKER